MHVGTAGGIEAAFAVVLLLWLLLNGGGLCSFRNLHSASKFKYKCVRFGVVVCWLGGVALSVVECDWVEQTNRAMLCIVDRYHACSCVGRTAYYCNNSLIFLLVKGGLTTGEV